MAAKAATHGNSPEPRRIGYARDLIRRSRALQVRRVKAPCVYILASKRDGILYIGVTSALAGRMAQHGQGLIEGFTKKYGVRVLVYYEMHETMDAAIKRESQLKKWQRAWKVRLIQQMNPEWRDLFDEHSGEILDGGTGGVEHHR